MAVTHVTDIKSAFELLNPSSIQKNILEMTHQEGRHVFREKSNELDETHLHAYLGIPILAGVHKSRDSQGYILSHSVLGDFSYFLQSNLI